MLLATCWYAHMLRATLLPPATVAVVIAVVRGSSKMMEEKKTVARSVRFVRSTRAVDVYG